MTTAQDQQSRAAFDLWYTDHMGDENERVREAAWETWQHLYAPVSRVVPEGVEARWFLHTMDNTEGIPGNAPYETVTEEESHPFGVPDRDFSAEFPVTSQPLFTAAQVQAMGRVPPGWQAVPNKPTHQQLDVIQDAVRELNSSYATESDLKRVYQELLSAAPRPPAAQVPNLSNSAELARTPLTDEQIDAILISAAKYGLFLKKDEKGQWFKRQEVIDACRAVEVMHGITNPTGD